jgi:hypothetical protein
MMMMMRRRARTTQLATAMRRALALAACVGLALAAPQKPNIVYLVIGAARARRPPSRTRSRHLAEHAL